jgi:hypothetical protein
VYRLPFCVKAYGQTTSPPVAEGLAIFAQKLLDTGFTTAEIQAYVRGESGHADRTGVDEWTQANRPSS